jgi:hypothetical protein
MGDASLSEDDPPLRACRAVLNRRPIRDERAETRQMDSPITGYEHYAQGPNV